MHGLKMPPLVAIYMQLQAEDLGPAAGVRSTGVSVPMTARSAGLCVSCSTSLYQLEVLCIVGIGNKDQVRKF